MNSTQRKWFPVVLFAATPILLYAQEAQTAPKLTNEQMEQFLQTAKIVKIKELSTGVTNSRRATLDNGTLQHSAHVQSIDEHKAKFEGERGTEMNFVDSWMYNVAAYRLSRVLDIDMVPVSVERKVDGRPCAVTWWVDDTMMEVDRKKKGMSAPDPDSWNHEMYIVRVFDQLIWNTDRNLQNLLIDPAWHIWMIDHTRAFRLYTSIKDPKDLVMCDRKLLGKLRELNAKSLDSLKPYIGGGEIRGLLARRDKIVAFFDQQVKAKGEAAVLYDRPAR
jgi:hypothetical protein